MVQTAATIIKTAAVIIQIKGSFPILAFYCQANQRSQRELHHSFNFNAFTKISYSSIWFSTNDSISEWNKCGALLERKVELLICKRRESERESVSYCINLIRPQQVRFNHPICLCEEFISAPSVFCCLK